MTESNRLPDETLVVRCGLPPFGEPTNLPTGCRHHAGVYGFSVQSAQGVPLDRLASWCPNRRVGVFSVAGIRSLGYDVVITPGLGYHATVVVPEHWDQEAADVLAGFFQSVANASPRGNR